jgi:hypothetical protein
MDSLQYSLTDIEQFVLIEYKEHQCLWKRNLLVLVGCSAFLISCTSIWSTFSVYILGLAIFSSLLLLAGIEFLQSSYVQEDLVLVIAFGQLQLLQHHTIIRDESIASLQIEQVNWGEHGQSAIQIQLSNQDQISIGLRKKSKRLTADKEINHPNYLVVSEKSWNRLLQHLEQSAI